MAYLVIMSNDLIPFNIGNYVIVQRVDICATHEIADVIKVQCLVKLVENANLTSELIRSGTSSGRVLAPVLAELWYIYIKTTTMQTIADQLLLSHTLSKCDTVYNCME